MPLRDHFRPPLSLRRHYHSFHNAWATYIASALNQQLPEGFFAEPNVQFGIEIDVGAFEDPASVWTGGVPGWTPPEPVMTAPIALIGDIVEINVFQTDEGPSLVGAIELVSPANKDREAHRDAFVSKCAAYVQAGVGLAVVDAVTGRRADLHAEFLRRIGIDPGPDTADLFAASYRPVGQAGDVRLAMWHERLAVGLALPTLPFWLRGGRCLQLNLETSYERTCREQKMPAVAS